MARGDPTYAHVDVTWPDDPRSRALSPAANWLYEVCLLAAVQCRRNVLPASFQRPYLCLRAGVKRRVWDLLITTAAEIDPESPIIFVNAAGRICLPNTGKRHPKLEWKDGREGPAYSLCRPYIRPIKAPPPSLPPSLPPLPTEECAEPAKPSPAPAVPPAELSDLELYAADRKLCRLWPKLLPAWTAAHLGVDVLAEVKRAHAWEVANPAKRKKDRPRFLGAWLARAQDRAGGQTNGPAAGYGANRGSGQAGRTFASASDPEQIGKFNGR